MHIHDLVYEAEVYHRHLGVHFRGVVHPISTPEAPVHQYRGIKYASIPARFRQSKLVTSYPIVTDATKFGPICPQIKHSKSLEETLFSIPDVDIPKQHLKQSEFECLNLNITCPAGLTHESRVPVMIWVHGGGDRGSGSNWLCDGGALVQRSIMNGKPIIMVTFNYRMGLFGSAASVLLRDDNKRAGDDGVGNYGLRDQRRAMDWVHHFISEFGGDPNNVTLFGANTGAADIVSHLLSTYNISRPLFHRAIVQSAIIEPAIPDVHNAGWHLSKLMHSLGVSTIDELRHVEAERLVAFGQTLRAVDDGVFFRPGWSQYFQPEDSHHQSHNHAHSRPPASRSHSRQPHHTHLHQHRSTSRSMAGSRTLIQLPSNLQPLIIGDSVADSALWAFPVSHWTGGGIIRRAKAVCQSLSRACSLLNAYDITAMTPPEEVVDRALELINDTRVAWPTECIAQNAKKERGGRGVWRYVFDQEGPIRGSPHHAADLLYLFDSAPLPETIRPSASSPLSADPSMDFPESFDFDEDDDDVKFCSVVRDDDEDAWIAPVVDEWSYARVRDAIQEAWLSFAYGLNPWNEDRIYVFGPEGETGERSSWIFEGRRRRRIWKEILTPLGMPLAQKLGVELSRGPPLR